MAILFSKLTYEKLHYCQLHSSVLT